MDRSARIIGVWIVGCMIVGGSLVIANVPLGEPWTDQQVWLVRLGLATIGLGVVGMVAEFLVAMKAWRGRRPAPQILDIAPATLCGYYQTHTDVQAKALVAPYIGEFVRVTGKVHNVDLKWYWRMVSFFAPDDPIRVHYMARFSRHWGARLTRLQRGQTVTVIGRIVEVSGYTFVLSDSRLEGSP